MAATAGVYLGTVAVVGFHQRPLSAPLRLLFALAGLALLTPESIFAGALIMNMGGFAAGLMLLIFVRIGLRRDELH